MPILNFKKLGYATELIRKTFQNHSRKLLVTVALGLISGFLGGFGISAIIPIFSLAITNGTGLDPISKNFQHVLEFFGWHYNLTFLLAFVGIILAGKAAFTYLATYLNSRMTADYERHVRNQLWKDTLYARWPYLMEQKVGYLQTVVMEEAQGGATVLNALSNMILTITSMFAYTVIAFNIAPGITGITLAFGATSFYLIKPLFYKIRTLSRNTSQTVKKVSHHINEHIIGAKTVKATATESDLVNASKDFFDKLREARLKHDVYGAVFTIFTEPASFVLISGIFIYSYGQPGFNFASFAAVVYLVQKIFTFTQNIQSKLNLINGALPYLENVLQYHAGAMENRETDAGTLKFSFKNELTFTNIRFAYDAANAPILENVSFRIERGQTIGIIGPSGTGKTTIVDLLLRLLEQSAGRIYMDGIASQEISIKDWRKHISYVSQDIFLLNDTIAANIRFYNQSITGDEIARVAAAAHIADFIDTLPEKYETVVGERGIRLSGGQRQRIILARALARHPQILVLDEATSALDNESEQKIQEAIKNLKGKLTILIIAHRLSTVMHSDNILVLKDGVIAEQGSPQALLGDNKSYFYKNYNISERQ